MGLADQSGVEHAGVVLHGLIQFPDDVGEGLAGVFGGEHGLFLGLVIRCLLGAYSRALITAARALRISRALAWADATEATSLARSVVLR